MAVRLLGERRWLAGARPPLKKRAASASAADVLDDRRELAGRREVDVFAFFEGARSVSGRPIKGLPRLVGLVTRARLHGEPAFEEVAPVRARAKIVGQARKRGGQVSALLHPDEGDGQVAHLLQPQ